MWVVVGWLFLVVMGVVSVATLAWMFTRVANPDASPLRRAALWLVWGGLGAVVFVSLNHLSGFQEVDRQIYLGVVDHRPHVLVFVSKKVTEIGSITTTLFLVLIVGAVAAYQRRRPSLVVVCLAAWVAAEVVRRGLTHLTTRPKPPMELSIGGVGGFPSGGVLRLVVALGLVALLLVIPVAARRHRPFVGGLVGAVVWVELMSRLILGRHWPIDLVAGLWLGCCLLGATASLTCPSTPPPEFEQRGTSGTSQASDAR